ncbi:hypothetical protein AZ66_31085 [Paenibacillus sp. E194]|uniref:hypothetical protein n=1 Tax=Paenibacillus sp. E194 TaxID=1458845 RepID=UPI0005DC7CD5|nr:hypothetical protein [Paenibacillus sp. E194]KJB84490.1 hypothetical protein AZ66_31085 [Paenibacillus sp. E194]
MNRISNTIEASPYAVKDLTIHAAIDSDQMQQDRVQQVEKVLRSIVATQLRDSGVTYTDVDLTQKVSVMTQNGSKDGVVSDNQSIPNWVWYGAGALGLLAVAGGITYAVVRKRRQEEEEEYYETEMSGPSQLELPSIDLENLTGEHQVRKQLESLAKKKPDEFVKLLRTWLVEESR